MSDERLSPYLKGVQVLDVSASVAGQFCAKLLADFGAEVELFALSDGPSLVGIDPERAKRWDGFLNAEKHPRRVGTLEELRAVLSQQANAVDIVVEDFQVDTPEALMLDALAGQEGTPLRASVSPFGKSGPYRDWKSDEVVDYAMGGLMYLAGDKAREPLLVPGMQGQLHAGLHLACGVVANLIGNRGTAKGSSVEVTVFEAMLMAHNWTIAAWTHRGRVLHRDVSQAVRCQDGFMLFVPRSYNTELFVLIGRPDLLADERFSTFPAFVKNYKQFWSVFEEWSKDVPRAEVWRGAQELRIPCCPVLTPGEVMELPQTHARGWLRQVNGVTLPGGAMRVTDAPASPAQHQAAPPNRVLSGRLPLEGVHVLEITSNWAGPIAARHLADLGATVVKIEFAKRPATRSSNYVGDDPQKYHYNRSGYFNKLNRNKLGISLNMAEPLGQDAFRKLVEWSHVLVENNSPRVMKNWGFTKEDLWKLNPALVISSISAFGSEGPISDYIAFGVNVEGSSGLASVVGYSKDEPFGWGNNHGDPVAGTFTAFGVLAKLYAQQVGGDGRGAFLDVAIQEAGSAFLAEAFLEGMEGVEREVAPVRDDATTVREVVRCVGNDDWLVLAIRKDDDLASLSHLLTWGDGVVSFDDLKVTLREGFHDALAAWAATVDHREGAAALQAIGIAAGPVLKNWELLSDNHLNSRSFFHSVSHPEGGTLPFPGFAWRFSDYPLTIRLPAPRFAEHTDTVLESFAGLCADDIRKLDEAGITARVPQQPIIS